jgi:hypothetical protein
MAKKIKLTEKNPAELTKMLKEKREELRGASLCCCRRSPEGQQCARRRPAAKSLAC